MRLDDLGAELRACHAAAGSSLHVDPSRLRRAGLRATGSALGRLKAWLLLGLALDAGALLGLVALVPARFGTLRLLAPLLLGAFAAAQALFAARQLWGLGRVDLGGPVVAVQRELERLRIARIRVVKWTLLLAPLLWIPLLAVTLDVALGVNAFAVLDPAWVAANLALGVAFIPLMLWASGRLADRFGGSSLLRRLLRDVAGSNLDAAIEFLDELARFEASTGR
jgi:hypothetical protein